MTPTKRKTPKPKTRTVTECGWVNVTPERRAASSVLFSDIEFYRTRQYARKMRDAEHTPVRATLTYEVPND